MAHESNTALDISETINSIDIEFQCYIKEENVVSYTKYVRSYVPVLVYTRCYVRGKAGQFWQVGNLESTTLSSDYPPGQLNKLL